MHNHILHTSGTSRRNWDHTCFNVSRKESLYLFHLRWSELQDQSARKRWQYTVNADFLSLRKKTWLTALSVASGFTRAVKLFQMKFLNPLTNRTGIVVIALFSYVTLYASLLFSCASYKYSPCQLERTIWAGSLWMKRRSPDIALPPVGDRRRRFSHGGKRLLRWCGCRYQQYPCWTF